METKENLVIIVLMMASYSRIAAANDLVANRGARQLVLLVSSMTALLALFMEGEGEAVAMGVKVSLLSH